MPKTKHSSHGGKTPTGSRYKHSYTAQKVLYGRIIDFSFTIGDECRIEQWFQALGWRDFFTINAPYYVETVKEFYSNLSNVGDDCDNLLELKSKVNKTVIKFDDRMLGNILNVPAAGSKFFETKKWPEDSKLVLEDCLRVFYHDENVFGGMAKPTNLLGAEHRLLHHITATHILPTSGGHEKMSYQGLYIMWHIVSRKALNLPHLIMKNMLRATFKVEGALPYGMVITKILSHFAIVFGNEVASRIDVGDIYNSSSLKRMGWKRVFEADKGVMWLPNEGGRRRKRVEGEGEGEEQGETQRPKQTHAPQMQQSQASTNDNSSLSMEVFMAEMRKMNIKMDNMKEEFLDLAKGLIESNDISSSEEEEGGGGEKP
ncbi:hypothetical protein CFOL_v3_16608 [Cephalotus follicularis]|uniref:Putative plant transposon protein domain-containing protein n=1 Tax=Cephalotus follicularis TaxID=3775 RepID=A0A1Q3BZ08_CEPFO|nr:hypothetical protein CFOL_v3_16608 [Cephalotus follicularis]